MTPLRARYTGRILEGRMIDVGHPAPNVTFGRSGGDDIPLADLWRDGPAVVAFLRHFG